MRSFALAVSMLLAIGADTAQAAPIEFSSAVASWQDPIGGDVILIDDVDQPGPIAIRWGNGASGYDFEYTPELIGAGLTPTDSVDFLFGTFTHVNNPTSGGISGVTLNLSFATNGSPAFFGPRLIQFDHNETPNACDTVANPGCDDDIVTTTSLLGPVQITVISDIWELEVRGFSDDNGATFSDEFRSPENATNEVGLWARATLVARTPEPGTALALPLVFLLIGLARRFRR